MWIVTKIGFFNLIQYEEDKEADLLTIKARERKDLELAQEYLSTAYKIEESDKADYRFRLKAPRVSVSLMIADLVLDIDYALTKPAITSKFPERATTYLNVWDDLYEIQETHQS